MIVGSTVQTVQVINRNTPFIVSSVSASLRMPDGTNTTPVTSVDSTVNLFSHTIYTNISLTQPGIYSLLLTVATSDGQTSVISQSFFASYSDVNAFVRERLQLDTGIVNDTVIDRGIGVTLFLLLNRYALYFTSYAAIPIADRDFFEGGLAILSAAYMRPFLPKTTPTGDFIGNKIGADDFTYADINAHAGQPLDPLEKQWFAEGQDLLDAMAIVAIDINRINDMPLFIATGRRRNARATLSLPDATTPDYDIFGDVATRYSWSRLFTMSEI